MSRAGYQQRIRSRVAELRQRIAADQAELQELEVAERVLERLGGSGSEIEGATQSMDAKSTSATREPTVADVAVRVLEEFGPLSSGDLLQKMQQSWRPDLAQTTLASTLSRAKKDGRIVYDNGLWATPASEITGYNKTEISDSEADLTLGRTASTSDLSDLLGKEA